MTEVITLDCLLCPRVIRDLVAGDENHLAYADYVFGVFDSPEYALERSPLRDGDQLLALMREPTEADLRQGPESGFALVGFDLIEEQTAISALTNCGGFPKAFSPNDLSAAGLVVDRARAFEIRERLRQEYPNEAHADCAVWAIWRRKADA